MFEELDMGELERRLRAGLEDLEERIAKLEDAQYVSRETLDMEINARLPHRGSGGRLM